MAKNRASRGTKLSSIKIVNMGDRGLKKEMLKLGMHVTRVEYRIDPTPPAWDYVPGESGV